MTPFEWGQADWAYAIPAFLAFGWLSLWLLNLNRDALARWIRPEYWPRLLPGWLPRGARRKLLWGTAGTVAASLALMQPRWGIESLSRQAQGLDILVALDLSQSMLAEDVIPSRLRVAKRSLLSLLEAFPADRFGLIGFAGQPQVFSPLTQDHDYLRELLDTVDPEAMRPQGSDLGAALMAAEQAQRRGAETAKGRVLVVITDGEDHEQTYAAAAKKLAATGVTALVLGVGTSRGAPVPKRDAQGRLQGYVERDGRPVLSSLGENTLRATAETLGGEYFSLGGRDQDLDPVVDYLKKIARGELGSGAKPTLKERYMWPLALALICLVVELPTPLRSLPLLLLVLPLTESPFAWAGDTRPVPADTWRQYQINRKGMAELKEGRAGDAAATFREGDDAVSKFNQGVSQWTAGDKEQSLASSGAAKALARSDGDAGVEARAAFNEGAALEAVGRKDEAVQSWLEGLEAAQRAGDVELTEATRQRLSGLQVEPPQDSKKDPKPREQESEPKEPQQQRQQAQKRFRSDELTAQDAERIMKELATREQELRRKGGRKTGEPQDREKDW